MSHAPAEIRGVHILVVDDNVINREMLVLIAEDDGVEVFRRIIERWFDLSQG